jgi:CheY-like chemotaxis protein
VPKVLDINATIAAVLTMLPRLLGEDIQITWQPGANLWPLRMDPSQLVQAVTNLCVNARDAIGGVGAISIKTANRVVDAAYSAEHADCAPGEYVQLTVTDNGAGMEKDVLAHVFEPFFTTKGLGKGTGLGLATVYGAVTQNRGFVAVSSVVGEGSSFEIHLPRHIGAAEPVWTDRATGQSLLGGETILLVEDEPSLLKVAVKILEAQGYSVLKAAGPSDALRVASAHASQIHLIVTDVIMPGMNGRDLVTTLAAIRPDLKHLYISGYTADIVTRQGVLDEGLNFLQKPFTRADLVAKVREVLDSGVSTRLPH